MRVVSRVALYAPTNSADGVRIASADEDAFTLGATAAERVGAEREATGAPIPIHLVGEFPSAADWGFPILLGHPGSSVVRYPSSASELAGAVRALEDDGEGPALVVAAELAGRRSPTAAIKPSSLGTAAVAFLLVTTDAARPFPLDPAPAGRSALSAIAQHLGKEGRDRSNGPAFVGDWDADPAAGHRVDPEAVARAAERDPSAVSEGAYVPRARYLENLPSRWRFAADECGACRTVTFPARGVCRRCRRRDALMTRLLPRDEGSVVAVTRIGKGGQPTEFDAQVEASGPYQVALVELEIGIRITLQVTDATPEELRVGDRVRTMLRRLYPMEGEWRYGRKAVALSARPTNVRES